MQAYRNYPPTGVAQRSPNAVRRGPGPPGSGIGGTLGPQVQHPNQRQAEMQNQMEAAKRDQAKRNSKRPTDRNMPDGLEDIVIGDGVDRYKKLRDVERRLDAVMMRKRLDISDSMHRSFRRYRTMRLWVSNTAENQPWQQTSMDPESFEFGSDSQATFRVKIEGRLLDNDDDVMDDDEDAADADADKDGDAMDTDANANEADKSKAPVARAGERTKLSHFFKQITVDFDRSASLQPDGFTQIEWKKPDRSSAANAAEQAAFDCLEFERKSDENINVTIKLHRDEQPERFRLSEDLAKLLDTEEEDRAGVVMGIWNYILDNHLQQDEDARTITLDANLKKLFRMQNQDILYFSRIPELVYDHLHPLPPVTLKYTIRVDKAYIDPDAASGSGEQPQPSAPTVYDLLVPTSDPFRLALQSMTHFVPGSLSNSTTAQPNPATATLNRLLALDDTLALAVQAITRSKAKHAFFTSLSKDPAKFINRWVSSQRRDLQVILGESQGGVGGVGSMGMGWDETSREEWRWGGADGVWGSKGAEEAAGLYLGRMRPAAQI